MPEVLNEESGVRTTFFEWLDEALDFVGDNNTTDIRTLDLKVAYDKNKTKHIYAVRVPNA